MVMGLNFIDIAILVLIFLSALVGFIRGFVKEALSLTTWVVAIVLAFVFYKELSTMLPAFVTHELARLGLSFFLIFIGILIVGSLINYLINKGIQAIGMGGLDRVLGGAFGVIRGALVVTLLVLLLGLGFFGVADYAPWQKSMLIPHFKQSAEWVKSVIPFDDIEQKIQQGAESIGLSLPEKQYDANQDQDNSSQVEL